MQLKKAGYPVDAIEPQAAIYLTIGIKLSGKKAGNIHFQNQSDVTAYLLNEARLALVPFYAFGADQSSDWYRLSVGCCLKEDIPGILKNLEEALKKVE
jgi:aspartate aminotransferase